MEYASDGQPPGCGCEGHNCPACGRGFLGRPRYRLHKMLGCEADARDGLKLPLTTLRNPVTATRVAIWPAFAGTDDEVISFAGRFAAYCEAGWNLGRLDPQEIRTGAGWVR